MGWNGRYMADIWPIYRRASGAAARTPALFVGFTHHAAVGRGAHDGTHFDLPVGLDRGLARAAVLLSPHDPQLGAERNVRAYRGEAQSLLLVVAVAGEHRQAHGLAVGIDHAVVVGRGVVGERDIEELVLLTVRIEERSHDLRHVLRIPGERHLLALRLGLEALERFAAVEIVIELDERAVAHLPGIQVVVFDVVGYEAAAD